MKNKIQILGLCLTIVFGAFAVEVTPEMAQTAVKNWRTTRDPMGCKFGKRVASSRRCEVGNAKFNVVKMEDGGFVVTSADTAIRPIVFFSDGEDVDEDPRNPLYALLQRDLEACAKVATDATAGGQVGGTALASARRNANSANEQAWAELLAKTSRTKLMGSETPADIRVGPLCSTTWNQEGVGGKLVYNYYTPKNYCCGCVATAAAQIMRTFEWPRSDVSIASFSNSRCKVGGAAETCESKGGYYVWNDMPVSPNSSITVTQQQAIGKLCYDLGVGLGMSWASSGSGTATVSVRHVLRTLYGYSQALVAVWSTAANKTASSALTKKAFVTNFDAKLPVQIGITTASGGGAHSIVADGYGYSGDKICYHLNYGWGGSSNGWYVPPEIGGSYTIIDDIVYNIYTNQPADKVILSGRLLGVDGKAAAGHTVEARQPGTVVATATTDAKGIFALYVSPSQTYTVRSTSNGKMAQASATTSAIKSVEPVLYNNMAGNSYYASNLDADICNATVGDIQLTSPTPVARIGSTDYYTFGEACYAATAGQTVTLLTNVSETVTLTTPANVDFNGHTLTGSFFAQDNTATTTLYNGTIVGGFDGKGGIVDTFPNGTVCFSNMTVTGTIWSDSHPLIFEGGTYSGPIRSGSTACTIRSGSFTSLMKEGSPAFVVSGGRFAADFSSVSTLPNEYYRWLQDSAHLTHPWYVTDAIDYATPKLADEASLGTNFTSAVVSCAVDIPYRGTDSSAKLCVVATAADGRAYTNLVALAAGTGTQNVSTTFDELAPAASYALTAEVIFGDGSTLNDVTMDVEVLHAARKVGSWIDEDATTFPDNAKWTVPGDGLGTVEDGKIVLGTGLSQANAVRYVPTSRPYDSASEIRMRMNALSVLPTQLPTVSATAKVAVTGVIDGTNDFFAVWSASGWTTTAVPCIVGQHYDVTYLFDYVAKTVEVIVTQVDGSDSVSLGRYSFANATPISKINFAGYCELASMDGDSWDANLVVDDNGVEYKTLEAAVAAGVTSVTLLWDCTWSPNTKCHLKVLNTNNKGFTVNKTQLPRGCRIIYNPNTKTYIITATRGVVLCLD